MEWYDFAIYGFTVVILGAQFFPSHDPVAGILSAFVVYAAAFAVRPLGGLFFGALGDKIGRRSVLSITILSMGIATSLIGVLPTHAQVGILAPILLIVCRLGQGFSAGGEAIGGPAFVLEHAPTANRGFWVNLTVAMSALSSFVAGMFILGLTTSIAPVDYSAWGWRIPFLVALPLSAIFLYIRFRTEETPAFKELEAKSATEKRPIRTTFKTNRLRMVQVFFIMGLSALGFYFLVGYFNTYLQTVGHFSYADALLSNSIALLSFAIFLPIAGRISDRRGRKPMLIAGVVAVVVVSFPAFLLASSGILGLAILGQVLLAAAVCTYGGGSYTFFVELFPTATRLTGAAIGYNISFAFFGGTAPFIGTYLVNATGNPVTPALYLVAVGIVVLIAVLRVPETRGRPLIGN